MAHEFGDKFFPHYSLKKLTTMKVGGEAWGVVEVEGEEGIKKLLQISEDFSLPLFILGMGSNVIFREEGFAGIVVLLGENFGWMERRGEEVKCGAGIKLFQLLNFCYSHSLEGLEELAGIPGTVGGGVVTNAGTPIFSIGERVKEVWIINKQGNRERLKPQVAYREGVRKEGVITQVSFTLRKGRKERIRERMEEIKRERRKKFPLDYPSAGCIFKNPSLAPAGELIEKAGLKGLRKGEAMVSNKHANFIINLGKATTEDILYLIEKVREKVYKTFKVYLETEIEIV